MTDIHFYAAQADELDRVARLGIDMEAFEASLAGKYILAQADREAAAAAQQLVDADPNDARLIARLQGDVKRATGLRLWIKTAIDRGRQAHQQLAGVDE